MQGIKYTATEAAKLLRDDLPPGYGFVMLVFPVQTLPVETDEPNACFICSHDQTIARRAMSYFLWTHSPFEALILPPDEP